MKRIIFILSIFFIATVASAGVLETRESLSDTFNNVVKDLKEKFLETQRLLKDSNDSSIETRDLAYELYQESKESEKNPTILTHGKKNPIVCDPKLEILVWRNNNWRCDPVGLLKDCEEIKGEEKICDNLGNCKCQQVGEYRHAGEYWTSCKNHIERYTHNICNFVNTESNVSYEVEKHFCSNMPREKYQACGKNGAKSSCKCTNGSSYLYVSGKSYCAKTPKCKTGAYADGFCKSNAVNTADLGHAINSTYSKKLGSNVSKLTVTGWADDLFIDASYTLNNGRVIYNRRLGDGWDKNHHTNYATHTINVNNQPGRLFVRIMDEGGTAINRVGYKVVEYSVSNIICDDGFVFNQTAKMCVSENIPVCTQ